ncbi:MAG TPA: glycosyltransferase family 4 protein [Wenzhouxiangellaceae bacterium]|nr:glycosyltransferase family 4 protein [Wenzhouxiangellaceae bacterium]
MSLDAWQSAGLALIAALVLTPLMRWYSLRRGLIDQPGARRSHSSPVARGGGLAIGISLVMTAVAFAPNSAVVAPFVGGAAIVSLLGWRDDHAPLGVGWRLGIQLLLAAGIIAWLGPVEAISIGGVTVQAAWLWTPTAVLAIVWLMNLFNFMDGSDGLASSQAVISFTLFAFAFGLAGETAGAWLAAVAAGASLGFLFWNRPPASIFLGDSGSLLLGWCAGAFALTGTLSDSFSVWVSFIIVSPFVIDATVTLCWRLARGERWYTPHTNHAYQYLIRLRWSHGKVLLVWIALNGLLVVPATVLALWKPQADLGVAAVMTVILAGAWYVVHFVVAKDRVTT